MVRTKPWITADKAGRGGESSSELAACTEATTVAVAAAVRRKRVVLRLAGKLKGLGVISLDLRVHRCSDCPLVFAFVCCLRIWRFIPHVNCRL